jgi:gliding motility-associated-like protein
MTIRIDKARLRVKAEDVFRLQNQPFDLKYNYFDEDFKFDHDTAILEARPIVYLAGDPYTPGTANIIFHIEDNDPRYRFEGLSGIMTIIATGINVKYGADSIAPVHITSGVTIPGSGIWMEPQNNIITLDLNDGILTAKIVKCGNSTIYINVPNSQPITIPITVSKAPVKYGFRDTVRYQGQPNPKFELYYIGGFVYGEDKSVINTHPEATCLGAMELWAFPGSYDITVSKQGDDDNYELIYDQPGKLRVLEVRKLPTAFTPNGDQVNDFWPWAASNYRVEIFNRLGTLIYTGNDGWDGRDRNRRMVDPGVYYYRAVSPPPENSVYTGTVEVIKP